MIRKQPKQRGHAHTKVPTRKDLARLRKGDTTEYLMAHPANRKMLLKAIEEINNGTAKLIRYEKKANGEWGPA